VNRLAGHALSWVRDVVAGWDRFWFTPADVATLALIRIFAGAMLFYTHLVWSLDLEAFFGPDGWLSAGAVGLLQQDSYNWSYFWWIKSSWLLWSVHLAALVVFALLTLGLFSRLMSVLAFVAALSYVGRVPGALFGLDQINVLLAMYLMVGPCGDAYSLDRVLAAWQAGMKLAPAEASIGANVAIRLIQLHMCVIYLFAGLSKLSGPSWWDGTAMWLALGNLEYQSLDMTWLARWPRLINLLTHATIFWEVYYCALIWPRKSRPVMLLLAIPLHLGIAICLGMITFGLIMLVGNLAFVPPEIIRAVFPKEPNSAKGKG
jgi:hypothetical protein